MLDVIGQRAPPETFFAEQAVVLNEGNAQHAHELRSFRQAYRDELAGALELAVPTMLRTIAVLRDDPIRDIEGFDTNDMRVAHRILIEAGTTREGRLALRTAHLAATLHVATRWNRTKQLTPNDLPDFLHAQSAIAYCNAFFTDGPTKHLLQQKNLQLQEDFGCFTASSEEAALAWLRSEKHPCAPVER